MTDSIAPGSYTISVAGLSQRFHVAGAGPFCIAHSGGPGIDSAYLRMPLLERHLTMIYLEPIGTGASARLDGHPFGYTIQRFADQLHGFIEALGIGSTYVLGHSHGGFVALDASLRPSERIAGLILYDSAAYTGADFMAQAGARILAFVSRHAGTTEATGVARAWKSLTAIHTDEDYTVALRGLLPAYFSDYRRLGTVLSRMQATTKATMLIGDNQPFDVRDRLPGFSVPTLIIVGADDFILGPDHASALAAGIPHARLETFARSGHFAHIEEPEEFADAIVRFTRERN